MHYVYERFDLASDLVLNVSYTVVVRMSVHPICALCTHVTIYITHYIDGGKLMLG